MKAKLDSIILYVKDPRLLKEFYVKNFNVTVIEEDDIWVLLNAGNAHIGLHKIGEKYMKSLDPHHAFDNNTKIVFEIEDDIALARQVLIDGHVPMRELKTFEQYDFWLCDGTDPEGNVFQLKKRKDG